MNDYSICFDEEMYVADRIKTLNVKGRYSRENFEINS